MGFPEILIPGHQWSQDPEIHRLIEVRYVLECTGSIRLADRETIHLSHPTVRLCFYVGWHPMRPASPCDQIRMRQAVEEVQCFEGSQGQVEAQLGLQQH